MTTVSQSCPVDGLQMAIKVAGNRSALARLLKIRPHSILKWQRRRVPIERVLAVSDATGVPAHLIRPDLPRLFPPPPAEASNGR